MHVSLAPRGDVGTRQLQRLVRWQPRLLIPAVEPRDGIVESYGALTRLRKAGSRSL